MSNKKANPGYMAWLVGEALKAGGIKVVQTKEKIHFRLDEFSKVVAIPNDSEIEKVTIGSVSKGN